MGFLSNLFGSSWQKQEDKGDEFRLDLLYKDAAYFYKKALDELGNTDQEATARIAHKLQEVRRKGVDDLLQEAKELLDEGDGGLARERLESAAALTDDPQRIREVESLVQTFESRDAIPAEGDLEHSPEEVASTEEDVYQLSLEGLGDADRERAVRMGKEFRRAYEACQNEDWERSLSILGQLLASNPTDPLLLEMVGLCHERRGNLDEALRSYRLAHAAEAGRPGTIHGLVEVLRHQGNGDEAAVILADAVTNRPTEGALSEHWIELAIDHALTSAERDHVEIGLELLKDLLSEPNAKPGGLYFNMAGILEQAGRDAEARTALEKAIAASPFNPLYKERLSDYLVHRGQELESALELLVSANQVETTTPGGVFGGGGGIKVRISPSRGRYLYKMARIYYLKGDDLEAEKTITTAVTLTRDPDVLGALETLKDEIRNARS